MKTPHAIALVVLGVVVGGLAVLVYRVSTDAAFDLTKSVMGPAVGALIALVGTYIAITLQLRHDLRERREERRIALESSRPAWTGPFVSV